ncbi:MAG: 6,7-dimethyl-8-ribityllumazine synthase [Alphaproteobacteria bacterium]|nr:6,7-dimethyl-8-ribityllumazine synthase [Alphaproteobacteria bacterium]
MYQRPHVMVVEARFYDDLADELYRNATAVLEAAGASHDRYAVAGVFEIPAAIKFALKSAELFGAGPRYDGYLALGCVIRGETTHYDYVCTESARALQDLAVDHAAAIGYGILTTENYQQALARAQSGGNGKDRGGHAARALLRQIELRRQFRLDPR